MIYKLDMKGKRLPTKGRAYREHAHKMACGKRLLWYEFYVSVPQGKKNGVGAYEYKYIRRRAWFPDDAAARLYEHSLKDGVPVEAFTWSEAHEYFIAMKRQKHSERHRMALKETMNRWKKWGGPVTIEATTLERFVGFLDTQALKHSPRVAQLRYAHLMAIARFCLKKGKVKALPFGTAGKPEAEFKVRQPAEPVEYFNRLKILPPYIRRAWELIGMTGMRISGACGIREGDIDRRNMKFRTVQKGGKDVWYKISPEIDALFEEQRRWKAQRKKPILSEYIFTTNRGACWNAASLGQATARRQKKAELAVITAHQLRHMMATAMLKAGMSDAQIQAGLAHDDPGTVKVYKHPDVEVRDVAIQAGIRVLSKSLSKLGGENADLGENHQTHAVMNERGEIEITCPCCSHKVLVDIEKKPQPLEAAAS